MRAFRRLAFLFALLLLVVVAAANLGLAPDLFALLAAIHKVSVPKEQPYG